MWVEQSLLLLLLLLLLPSEGPSDPSGRTQHTQRSWRSLGARALLLCAPSQALTATELKSICTTHVPLLHPVDYRAVRWKPSTKPSCTSSGLTRCRTVSTFEGNRV